MELVNIPLTNLEIFLKYNKTYELPCHLKMFIDEENKKYKSNLKKETRNKFSWGTPYDYDSSPINQFTPLNNCCKK